MTHTRLSLAVQVRFASQMHDGVKQQSHRRLTGCNERKERKDSELSGRKKGVVSGSATGKLE